MLRFNKYKNLLKFYSNFIITGGTDIGQPNLELDVENFKLKIPEINRFFMSLKNDSLEFGEPDKLGIDIQLYLLSLMVVIFSENSIKSMITSFTEGVLKLGEYLNKFKYSHLVCIGDSPSKIGYLLKLLYPNLEIIIFPFSYFKTLTLIADETRGVSDISLHENRTLDVEVFKYLDDHLRFMYHVPKRKILFLDYISSQHRTVDVLLRYLESKGWLTSGKSDLDTILKRVVAIPDNKRQLLATQELFDNEFNVVRWLDTAEYRCLPAINVNTRKLISQSTLFNRFRHAKINVPFCKLIVILAYFFIISGNQISQAQYEWWINDYVRNRTKIDPKLHGNRVVKGLVFDNESMQIKEEELLVLFNYNLMNESGKEYSYKFIIDPKFDKVLPPEYIYMQDGTHLAIKEDNPWIYHKFKDHELTITENYSEMEEVTEKRYPTLDVTFLTDTEYSRKRAVYISGAAIANMFSLDEIHFPSILFEAAYVFNLKIYIYGKVDPIICAFSIRANLDNSLVTISKYIIVNTDSGLLVIAIPSITKIEIIKKFDNIIISRQYIEPGHYKELRSTLRTINVREKCDFSPGCFFYIFNNTKKIIGITSRFWLLHEDEEEP